MKTHFDSTRAALWLYLLFLSFSVSAVDDSSGLHCPPDYWLDCDDEIWNLSRYGQAKLVSYNGTEYYNNPEISYHINACNVGYIHRTWHVKDGYGTWHHCTQTIHVRAGNSYQDPQITWPMNDLELEGCDPPTAPEDLPYGYKYPTYTHNNECSMIGRTYTDQTFYFDGACKKLVRTWKIIDWCTYDPNGYNSGGIWTYNQIIKIINTDIPSIEVPDDLVISSTNCQGTYVNIPTLRIGNTECGDNARITNDSPYASSGGADASGEYPIGITIVLYNVSFGCSRDHIFSVEVNVQDESTPVPVCYGGLSTTLMPTDIDEDGMIDIGLIEIWASDFDNHSYGACDKNELRFSFSNDPDDRVRVFDCEDLGENQLEMWVTDQEGNQAYCTVMLDIQNNSNDIPNCDEEVVGVKQATELTLRNASTDDRLTISPNPFLDQCSLNFNVEQSQEIFVRLVDIQGREMLSSSKYFEAGRQIWNLEHLSNLNSGTYFYELLFNGKVRSGKMIKIQ